MNLTKLMKAEDVQRKLGELKEARSIWGKAHAKFNNQAEALAVELVYRGLAARLSVEAMSSASGLTPKRIRILMRQHGLDPKAGRTVLSQTASDALIENATIMGINPEGIDLLSPLAYLPMGADLKQRLSSEGN